MRRTNSWLFVAFALILVACSGADAVEQSTTSTTGATTTIRITTTTTIAPTTTTTEATAPVSPLNGLAVEDPARLERGVLAVKIDNHWNARPQSGLSEADAVYELLVEAGLTRFIALFHHNDADYLGPMRSGRPTDPTLLKPLNATFAISGAQDWVIARIRSAGVPIIGEVRPATFRIGSRSAPHNLYVDTAKLREYAEAREYPNEPPGDMFQWGETNPAQSGAASITISFSAETTALWEWDGERYFRTTNGAVHQTIDRDGETAPLTTETLIVLFAPRYTASPPGGNGTAVPAMDTVGTGKALAFFAGGVTEATWARDAIDEMFLLSDADGNELTIPPGNPWISLVPDNRTVTW